MPTPAATARRTNSAFFEESVSRFVPSPIRRTSTPATLSVDGTALSAGR
jgi:hypothetical protein